MTVVLSETLKEIIKKNDTAQEQHPYSVFNKQKANVKYVATKPWEHVQRGEKPAGAGLYPISGYCGHVPSKRDTHAASFQSSLKLAQQASISKTIREGDCYADGGHFVTSQEVGSLRGGKDPSMPPSATRTPARRNSQPPSARESRLAERLVSRQNSAMPSGEVKGDVLFGAPPAPLGSARSTARSHRSTARSRRSEGRATTQVKGLFEQLPPSRQEAIVQELSSGWLQNK